MARKRSIEIRDPLHVFVRLSPSEKTVLDCAAFQRLRHIQQLGMSHLIYPGATHRRFEHSLGVMELASRIFDVVTAPERLTDAVREVLPDPDELGYWRKVLRMAALCHDTGHLPFSHVGEDLLPEGASHETITENVIRSDEMSDIWTSMKPPLHVEDVVLMAVEPDEADELPPWQAILNEIITSEVFGADRMDYLLRDSLHTGVAYGRFDHFRLIDTMRILPPPPTRPEKREEGTDEPRDPTLGIEQGGKESAEALLLARYFMFSQVYLHRVRRIYDIHLRDFLREWLPDGQFSLEVADHLQMTDDQVLVAIAEAAADAGKAGHIHAERIVRRGHFKVLYEPSPETLDENVDAGQQVFAAAQQEFGEDAVRYDNYTKGGGDALEFPVLRRRGDISSSAAVSDVLRDVPVARANYVFIDPREEDNATQWLRENEAELVAPREEEDDDEGEGI